MVGGTKFYSRKEIRDVIAYLNILANTSDNISFERIVNEPKRGVGPGTLEKYGHLPMNRACLFLMPLQMS